MSALDKQTGGNHYKNFPIQPIEAIHKNGLDWFQGNITKYTWRHHFKNGAEDLKKVIHYAELALELQYNIKPANELEAAVNAVATAEELSAVHLADSVLTHKVCHLILKRIVNMMLNEGREQELEDAINEVIANHSLADSSLTTYLDIKLKE